MNETEASPRGNTFETISVILNILWNWMVLNINLLHPSPVLYLYSPFSRYQSTILLSIFIAYIYDPINNLNSCFNDI